MSSPSWAGSTPSSRIGELIDKLRGRAIYTRAITSPSTGIRRGEVLALRWPNVDLDAKVIRIRETLEETKAHGLRVKPPKTKAGRRDVSLPEIVVDALREHRRQQLELRIALGMGKMPDDALVFPAPLKDGYQSPRAFSKEWARVAASIGFKGIGFHALRHTHVSQLIDAGIDIVTISKRLGHAKPDITLRIYAHLFRKDDSKASAAINTALAGLGGGVIKAGWQLGGNRVATFTYVPVAQQLKPAEFIARMGGRAVEGTGLESRCADS